MTLVTYQEEEFGTLKVSKGYPIGECLSMLTFIFSEPNKFSESDMFTESSIIMNSLLFSHSFILTHTLTIAEKVTIIESFI